MRQAYLNTALLGEIEEVTTRVLVPGKTERKKKGAGISRRKTGCRGSCRVKGQAVHCRVRG